MKTYHTVALRSDVPVPPKHIPTRPKVGVGAKYGFGQFLPGHNAFYPTRSEKEHARIASAVSIYARTTGKKFTYRTVTENGQRGVSVWRLS